MHARGNIVVVMDADLQDPPEELLPFIEKVREGWDVVYAIRTKRKENLLKRISYRLYYRLLKRLAVLDIPLDAGDFCVMRGQVVDAINRLPERNCFVRGLRSWVGFRQTGIAYERQSRFAGEPKYNFRKLFRLAVDGIINFSYRPLQFIMSIGLLLAFFSMLGAVFVVIQYVTDFTLAGFNPRNSTGWTSLIFVILFFSAANLICMGILGEYIGRLFEEVKHRPVWIVKRRINLPRTLNPATAGGMAQAARRFARIQETPAATVDCSGTPIEAGFLRNRLLLYMRRSASASRSSASEPSSG